MHVDVLKSHIYLELSVTDIFLVALSGILFYGTILCLHMPLTISC